MERYLIAAVLGVLFLLVWPTLPPLHYLIAASSLRRISPSDCIVCVVLPSQIGAPAMSSRQ